MAILLKTGRCIPLCSRNINSHQGCLLVLSKFRKLEILLKDLFQNNDCTERTSDERTSPVHSGTRLTSLAEFDFSPSKMAEMKFISLKFNVSFRTNKSDNNYTTYTDFLELSATTVILQSNKKNISAFVYYLFKFFVILVNICKFTKIAKINK